MHSACMVVPADINARFKSGGTVIGRYGPSAMNIDIPSALILVTSLSAFFCSVLIRTVIFTNKNASSRPSDIDFPFWGKGGR